MNMGNLFLRAAALTGTSTIQWFSASGRASNGIGLDVVTFADPVPVRASVQPVPRSIMQQMGLDFNKEYVMVYAAQKMDDLARDRSGDQFQFSFYRYQILSNTEWHPVNGWNGSLAVKVQSP
jgi:hypothetical protein